MSFSTARLLNKKPPNRKLTIATPLHLKRKQMELPNSDPHVSSTFPHPEGYFSDASPLTTQFLRCLPPNHRVPTMFTPCPQFLRCSPPAHRVPTMHSHCPHSSYDALPLPEWPLPDYPSSSRVSAPAQAPVYPELQDASMRDRSSEEDVQG